VRAWFLHLACQGAFLTPAPVSYATYQEHFKHEQPQVLSADSLVTIRTIQQTQDAANVLWVGLYRHNSRHAAWPTIILRYMENCFKDSGVITTKSECMNKTKFHEYSWHKFFMNIDWNDHIPAMYSMRSLPQFVGGLLGCWGPGLKPI